MAKDGAWLGPLVIALALLGLFVILSPLYLCVATVRLLSEGLPYMLPALASWLLSTIGLVLALNPEVPKRSIWLCTGAMVASACFYGYILTEGAHALGNEDGFDILIAALSPALSTTLLMAAAMKLFSAISANLAHSKYSQIEEELLVHRSMVSSLNGKLDASQHVVAVVDLVSSCGGDVHAIASSQNMLLASNLNHEIMREKEAIRVLIEKRERLGEEPPDKWKILSSAFEFK